MKNRPKHKPSATAVVQLHNTKSETKHLRVKLVLTDRGQVEVFIQDEHDGRKWDHQATL